MKFEKGREEIEKDGNRKLKRNELRKDWKKYALKKRDKKEQSQKGPSLSEIWKRRKRGKEKG